LREVDDGDECDRERDEQAGAGRGEGHDVGQLEIKGGGESNGGGFDSRYRKATPRG
jgi:hypothetical protein